MCLDFSSIKAKIGGSFEVVTESVYYVQAQIVQCVVTNPGDCEVIHDSVSKSTITNLELLSDYFRNF